jgi:hypothetical protein
LREKNYLNPVLYDHFRGATFVPLLTPLNKLSFMKAQGTIVALCAFLIFNSTFSSCKKDNDKKASCKLIKVTQNSGGEIAVINITYNDAGKISTVSTTTPQENTSKVFTYNGNTINVVTTNASASRRDSLTLNANGRPANIRMFSDNTGANWINQAYEYNGNELVKMQETSNSSSTPVTTTATYNNGNLVSLASGSTVSVLEYYTDKNTRQGDYLELIAQINYGVIVYPQKNLLKSISNAGGMTNFVYDFDSDGKIINVVVSSGSNSTILNYQYQCN